MDFKKGLQQLKQMIQFGPGTTFAELMAQFREIGDELVKLWPWVPFDLTGDIKCTVIPTLESDPFELILVRVEKPSRFPNDEGQGFMIDGIKQNITIIHGTLLIERPEFTEVCSQGMTRVIEPGELIALNYSPGLYLFRQEPAIAEATAFRFEAL